MAFFANLCHLFTHWCAWLKFCTFSKCRHGPNTQTHTQARTQSDSHRLYQTVQCIIATTAKATATTTNGSPSLSFSLERSRDANTVGWYHFCCCCSFCCFDFGFFLCVHCEQKMHFNRPTWHRPRLADNFYCKRPRIMAQNTFFVGSNYCFYLYCLVVCAFFHCQSKQTDTSTLTHTLTPHCFWMIKQIEC